MLYAPILGLCFAIYWVVTRLHGQKKDQTKIIATFAWVSIHRFNHALIVVDLFVSQTNDDENNEHGEYISHSMVYAVYLYV